MYNQKYGRTNGVEAERITGWVCCYATMQVVLHTLVQSCDRRVELFMPALSGVRCTIG